MGQVETDVGDEFTLITDDSACAVAGVTERRYQFESVDDLLLLGLAYRSAGVTLQLCSSQLLDSLAR